MTNSKQRMIIPKKRPSTDDIVPYKNRGDLTLYEVNAINHYKDLVNGQYEWDYNPKGDIATGIDCFMVNEFLRNRIKKNALSSSDIQKIERIIKHVSSAVNKSTTPKKLSLIKGLSNPQWIKAYRVGDIYIEKAFGSYTTSQKIANRYARQWKRGKPVYLKMELPAGHAALYLDLDEREWLLPRNMKFRIMDVVNYQDAIVYILTEE